jgi:hypothetical protein
MFVALPNAGSGALAGLTEAARAAFRVALVSADAMLAAAAFICTRVPLQRV